MHEQRQTAKHSKWHSQKAEGPQRQAGSCFY
jgi:hypothetical protein